MSHDYRNDDTELNDLTIDRLFLIGKLYWFKFCRVYVPYWRKCLTIANLLTKISWFK